jgi:hypothetical protein
MATTSNRFLVTASHHCKRETPIWGPIWLDIGPPHIGKIGFYIGIHIGSRLPSVSYQILCLIFQWKTKSVQFHRFHFGSVSNCWPFMSDFSTKNKKYPVPSEWYRKRRSLWRQSRKKPFPTQSSLGCCKVLWTFLTFITKIVNSP